MFFLLTGHSWWELRSQISCLCLEPSHRSLHIASWRLSFLSLLVEGSMTVPDNLCYWLRHSMDNPWAWCLQSVTSTSDGYMMGASRHFSTISTDTPLSCWISCYLRMKVVWDHITYPGSDAIYSVISQLTRHFNNSLLFYIEEVEWCLLWQWGESE